MKWKQFFTPVQSFSFSDAKSFMEDNKTGSFTLLDVRQPEEYEASHLPGAKLIPLADVGNRLQELDADTPTIVYCAIGGRSRVAAQMLAGKGFKEVYNLTGGIKAWKEETAFGPEDQGIDLFSGNESPEETLIAAYSLEKGLRDFYISMQDKPGNENARRLFHSLSEIEVKHQERVFDEYIEITGRTISREKFDMEIVTSAMEGGLTTEEYLSRYAIDLNVSSEIISMAMAIEAQALDLYQRASERAGDEKSKTMLLQIADEERNHLQQLGNLFNQEGL